jgi:hypothetical protein
MQKRIALRTMRDNSENFFKQLLATTYRQTPPHLPSRYPQLSEMWTEQPIIWVGADQSEEGDDDDNSQDTRGALSVRGVLAERLMVWERDERVRRQKRAEWRVAQEQQLMAIFGMVYAFESLGMKKVNPRPELDLSSLHSWTIQSIVAPTNAACLEMKDASKMMVHCRRSKAHSYPTCVFTWSGKSRAFHYMEGETDYILKMEQPVLDSMISIYGLLQFTREPCYMNLLCRDAWALVYPYLLPLDHSLSTASSSSFYSSSSASTARAHVMDDDDDDL